MCCEIDGFGLARSWLGMGSLRLRRVFWGIVASVGPLDLAATRVPTPPTALALRAPDHSADFVLASARFVLASAAFVVTSQTVVTHRPSQVKPKPPNPLFATCGGQDRRACGAFDRDRGPSRNLRSRTPRRGVSVRGHEQSYSRRRATTPNVQQVPPSPRAQRVKKSQATASEEVRTVVAGASTNSRNQSSNTSIVQTRSVAA